MSFSYVVCRQRLYKAGVKQRLQFIKEIKSIESLQPRALHGVRVHREFCNPILTPPSPAEIITLSDREMSELENILVTTYWLRLFFNFQINVISHKTNILDSYQKWGFFRRMFANAFQSGFISVFYSVGSNPLSLWDKSVSQIFYLYKCSYYLFYKRMYLFILMLLNCSFQSNKARSHLNA